MAVCRDHSSCLTGDAARDPATGRAHMDMWEQLTAFDDDELSDWLMECIEDGSQNFLCALAEAAVAANVEEYVVIRPALLALRRKHHRKHPP
jgi:hypothetical protein